MTPRGCGEDLGTDCGSGEAMKIPRVGAYYLIPVRRDELDPLLEAINRGADQMPLPRRREDVGRVARRVACFMRPARPTPGALALSVADLERWGACAEQVDLMALRWGAEPVEVTEDTLLEAADLGLDMGWLAERVLPLTSPPRAAYNAQVAPLGTAYAAQMDAIWTEFQRGCAVVLAAVLRELAEREAGAV